MVRLLVLDAYNTIRSHGVHLYYGMVHIDPMVGSGDPMDGSGGTHHLALCMAHVTMGSSVLHLGPAHPAAHGVLRCILLMQGEYIPSTVLTLGLLHRDTETSDGDEAYEYLDQETTSSSGPTSRRADHPPGCHTSPGIMYGQ